MTLPRVGRSGGRRRAAHRPRPSQLGRSRGLTLPVTEIDVARGGVLRYVAVQRARPSDVADRVAGRPGRAGSSTLLANVALGRRLRRASAPTPASTAGARSGDLLAAYFGEATADPRLPHVPGSRAPRDHIRPPVQGRGRGALALGVHGPHPGARRKRRARRPSRPIATSSCAKVRGPSRCRTSRSRRTTCVAATLPRSARSTEEQRFYLESRGVPPERRGAADRRRVLRRGRRAVAGPRRSPIRCARGSPPSSSRRERR